MAVGILSVNAGQGCAITTRLLVHNSIRPAFVQMAAAMAAHIKVGNAADPSVTMGPLIRESQRAKVEHYVALGKAAGATVVCGGGRPAGLDKGFFTDLTLFDNVTNDMAIAQDEIFGPVGCIIGFDTDEEAAQEAALKKAAEMGAQIAIKAFASRLGVSLPAGGAAMPLAGKKTFAQIVETETKRFDGDKNAAMLHCIKNFSTEYAESRNVR
jgi:acyl-CoA reductase-like NAD-dependent aldehyde dehydrogenase